MISNSKIRRAQAAVDAVFERVKAGDHSARIELPESYGELGPLIESHNRVLALAEAAGTSGSEAGNQKRALETAAQVCQRASAGDLEARITNTEEFGDLHSLLDAINHLLDVTDAFVRESSASLEFAGQRKFWRPFLLRGMPGDFRRGAQVIDHARQAMEQRHNLTEAFQATVSHVAGVVSEAAKALEGTANEMNGNAEATRTQSVAVSSASDRTATNTQAVAAGAEELSAAIGEISQQTSATMKAVQGIVSETVRANEAAAQLAGAAQKIDRVVKFIAEVAGQTNLLALNATIEAARAGELGRGFAVVAGEVKGLATQARNATSEISALMAEVQSASDATAAAIKLIDERVHGMREMTTAIASAVEQQSAATMEISRNVQEAASGSGEVSRSVSMIASASEATGKAAGLTLDSARRLSGEADALDGKVRDFLVKIRQA